MSVSRSAWGAVALLVALPLLVQLPALLGWLSANPLFMEAGLTTSTPSQILPGFPGWIDGNAGVTTQALGKLAADQWLHGQLPWWNPYSGLGMPLAAEMQNSALFLPFVLLLHFADGVLYLKISMQILTGLFMLALLSELGLDRRSGLVGAVLMEFCGTLAWFSHGPIMPVPFLPLLVLGIERSARLSREGGRGGWPLVAVAIAGSIVAGFPETAFMDGLLALCIAGWRVASAGWRWTDVAWRIGAGGVLGLLLSAPAWLPFAESLPSSFLGQNTDFAGTHLMAASYGLLLFPYLLGTLIYGFDHVPGEADVWWHTGGYCDLVLVVAAAVALAGRTGGRHRALRWVLAGWLLASLLKSAGMPRVSQAFDLIPLIRQTMFYVYASPGWAFALSLLAALGLDDLRRGQGPPVRRMLLVGAACGLLAARAAFMARKPVHALAAVMPHYAIFPLLSLLWAFGAAAAFIALTMRGRDRAAALLLAVNAIGLFALPVFSGVRHARADLGPVAFLRHELGLHRFYSMSLLQPNYGAYFRIASLNWNAVPVPLALIARIGRDLDPGMDMTGLFGSRLQRLGMDVPSPATVQSTTATAIGRLEALGVSDLLVPHGFDPLAEEISAPAMPGTLAPQAVQAGTVIEVAMPPGLTGNARIEQAGVDLGTYAGHPAGRLEISVCVAARCSTGAADLAQAVDNHPLWMPLDDPLETRAGDQVHYRLRVASLAGGLAVWNDTLADGEHAPFVLLHTVSHEPTLARVYADPTIDILRLPDPAPYFATTEGSCVLQPESRMRLAATCAAPARLIRRELVFPGWSATVNDRHLTPDAYEATFQSIPLPAGRSDIRFGYAPPHVAWAWGAMLLGLLLLGGGILTDRPRR
ncbi:hypothetical protein [Lichenicola sp.]|uniref:hypothetical protein n=1 Tax=Lichenicola sp. TaxID=2804529 RepID=UPI003AFF7FDC